MWTVSPHLALAFLLMSSLRVQTSALTDPLSAEAFLLEASQPDFKGWLQDCRRHLHSMPELYFQETETSAYIQSQLSAVGIPFQHPLGVTGIKATIGSDGAPNVTVALRADMDALPITEEVDVPYKSAHAGRMHACGHDAHMCMLLGAAWLLNGVKSSLPGRVALVFQPAEEAMGGAKAMIEDGVLEGVDAIHGLHVWPALPAGTIATRAGPIMAASDRFSATITGRGGHGAMPHTTIDPVVAGSAAVLALQALVSRETSPTDGAVVTVARFNTGPGAFNVIPDAVDLSGTIRALTADTFERLHRRVEEVLRGVAASYGCNVTAFTWSPVPYPPTVNDAGMASLVHTVACRLAGAGGSGSARAVELPEPSMAAEDFSFYAHRVPAAFTFLGIGDPSKGTDVQLHNPRFQVDEDQLPLGSALHAAVAVAYLRQRQRQKEPEEQQQQPAVEPGAEPGAEPDAETAAQHGWGEVQEAVADSGEYDVHVHEAVGQGGVAEQEAQVAEVMSGLQWASEPEEPPPTEHDVAYEEQQAPTPVLHVAQGEHDEL